jgi:hypothetical protein
MGSQTAEAGQAIVSTLERDKRARMKLKASSCWLKTTGDATPCPADIWDVKWGAIWNGRKTRHSSQLEDSLREDGKTYPELGATGS